MFCTDTEDLKKQFKKNVCMTKFDVIWKSNPVAQFSSQWEFCLLQFGPTKLIVKVPSFQRNLVKYYLSERQITLRSMGRQTLEETCAAQNEIICPQFLKLGAKNLCWLTVHCKNPPNGVIFLVGYLSFFIFLTDCCRKPDLDTDQQLHPAANDKTSTEEECSVKTTELLSGLGWKGP